MKKIISLALISLLAASYSVADTKISIKVSSVAGRLDDAEILNNLDAALTQETGSKIVLDKSDIQRFKSEAHSVSSIVRGDKTKTEDQQQALWDDLRMSLTVPNLIAKLNSKEEGLLYGMLSKKGPHNFELVLSNGSRYFINGWKFEKLAK
jgi:hypothetical protein